MRNVTIAQTHRFRIPSDLDTGISIGKEVASTSVIVVLPFCITRCCYAESQSVKSVCVHTITLLINIVPPSAFCLTSDYYTAVGRQWTRSRIPIQAQVSAYHPSYALVIYR
jgi:hypothetical protein